MKKLICVLLVFSMLLSFASCTAKPPASDANESSDGAPVQSDIPLDYEDAEFQKYMDDKSKKETTALVREKYGSNDFQGYSFRILAMTPGEHYLSFVSDEIDTSEIWYEEDNADVQVHSVFERNILTEELLNIKIKPLWGGNTYETPEMCERLIKAGGDDFDMMYGSQLKTLPLAMQKNFINLYDIETFDPKNEWWDQQYVDTFTFKHSKLFTITGDYLMMDEMAGEVIFYNNQMVENFNLTEPADLVEEGTWTVDRMMELAEAVSADTNGDGMMTRDDTWGVYDNYYALVHFVEGCDIHMTELDEEGIPQVIIESEQFSNAVQRCFEKIIMSPATLLGEGNHATDLLEDDRVLFNYDQMGVIFRLREMEGDFGILPMPKLNDEQKDYTSVVNGIWVTTLSVPITAHDIGRIGTIMDVLGGFSTDTVDNTVDEVLLGTRLIRQKRSRDMLRYIVESREYDWAKDIPWGYPIYNLINAQSDARTFTLASGLKSNIKIIKSQLKGFIKFIKKDN